MEYTDAGKRILFIREKEGLNQEEFANKLGLTKSAISGYETGRRLPPKSILKSIAQIFMYSETWLLTGQGRPKLYEAYEGLKAVYDHFHCTDFEINFLGKYFGMGEKDRHLFCYYINYLFEIDTEEISPEQALIQDALQKLNAKDNGDEEIPSLKDIGTFRSYCVEVDQQPALEERAGGKLEGKAKKKGHQ